jgi:hypothetical protein
MKKLLSRVKSLPPRVKIQLLDMLLAFLVGFGIVYLVFVWQRERVSPPAPIAQVVIVHPSSPTNILFDTNMSAYPLLIGTNLFTIQSYLHQGKSEVLVIGDIVVIKFFNITGIVLETHLLDPMVKVLYRNYNNELCIIELDRIFISRVADKMIHLHSPDLSR